MTKTTETKRSYATSAQTLGVSLKVNDRVKLVEGGVEYAYYVIRSGGHQTRIALKRGDRDNSRLVPTVSLTPAPLVKKQRRAA